MSKEPLITAAGLSAVAGAVIAAVVAFGVNLSEEQVKAVLGLVAVVGPFAVAVLARTRVAPWTSVVAQQTTTGDVQAGPASKLPVGTKLDLETADSD